MFSPPANIFFTACPARAQQAISITSVITYLVPFSKRFFSENPRPGSDAFSSWFCLTPSGEFLADVCLWNAALFRRLTSVFELCTYLLLTGAKKNFVSMRWILVMTHRMLIVDYSLIQVVWWYLVMSLAVYPMEGQINRIKESSSSGCDYLIFRQTTHVRSGDESVGLKTTFTSPWFVDSKKSRSDKAHPHCF